jgi:hypothetical protein
MERSEFVLCLADLEQFSDAWMHVWREIKRLDDEGTVTA